MQSPADPCARPFQADSAGKHDGFLQAGLLYLSYVWVPVLDSGPYSVPMRQDPRPHLGTSHLVHQRSCVDDILVTRACDCVAHHGDTVVPRLL